MRKNSDRLTLLNLLALSPERDSTNQLNNQGQSKELGSKNKIDDTGTEKQSKDRGLLIDSTKQSNTNLSIQKSASKMGPPKRDSSITSSESRPVGDQRLSRKGQLPAASNS